MHTNIQFETLNFPLDASYYCYLDPFLLEVSIHIIFMLFMPQ